MGNRPASKGTAAAAFFQSAEGCNPSPPQLSQSNLVGSSREHRWPRAIGPTPGKLQRGICVLRTGFPQVRPEASSLPREVLLFYLKGNSIGWQGFGHQDAAKNAQGKPYLLQNFNALSTPHFLFPAFLFWILHLCLSFGVLAECWIIVRCSMYQIVIVQCASLLIKATAEECRRLPHPSF